MPERSDSELARVFAEAAKMLAAQESLGKTSEELVTLAVSVVPGADSAGLSLARNGNVETFAATDELAMACDAAQYDTGEGPCLQAVWEDRTLYVEDFATDTRWPAFSARAAQLGAGSLLACHLSSERGSLSALNLYAREPGAFDAQSRTVAVIYAAHATIALESSRLEGDLRNAVETRQGIGQAVGIVMERHGLTAKHAFDLLVQSSQKVNVKLRELADVVVRTGIDPRDTRVLATVAAQEAGNRIAEPKGRLRTGDSQRGGPDAKLATAQAHDRAVQLHEKQAAAARANAAEHERQAELHRQAAAKARAAAQAELGTLDRG